MNIRLLIVDNDPQQREDLCELMAAVGLDTCGLDDLQALDAATRQAVLKQVEDEADTQAENRGPVRSRGFLVLANDSNGIAADGNAGTASPCCFVKPLDLRVLRAACSRLPPDPQAPLEVEDSAAGDPWTYDATRWILRAPNGRSVQLSMIEARVVHCLLSRAGDIATRADILAFLQRPNVDAQARNLDVTVSRLRKKVESMCWRKFPANAARGHGYVFNGRGVIVN